MDDAQHIDVYNNWANLCDHTFLCRLEIYSNGW